MLEQRIEEVNKANHAFYAAFGNLDIVEMDRVTGSSTLLRFAIQVARVSWRRISRPSSKRINFWTVNM
ncbi:MAG: hypothetical protein E8D47_04510 [Nitrospira sp.]|nr:MAG: hypothetical protein E8D47_04510 [Nitrospira sp.]